MTQYQLAPKSKWRSPTQLKLPKSECPDFWIRLPRHKWPKTWQNIQDSAVPLERNLCGSLRARFLWERQFENFCCLFVHRQQGLFLSVYVDDIKMEGKKNPGLHVERLMKHCDLEKPTPLLDQVYLGCTQPECKPNKNLVDENKQIFRSLTSAEAVEKLPG